nr:glucokinase [Quercus suber]
MYTSTNFTLSDPPGRAVNNMPDTTSDVSPGGPSENNDQITKSNAPHSKSGWDGKLRVNKQATLANPEALSDPEYSDDDAPPVDQIEADEDLLDGEDPDTEEIDVQHSRISSIPALRLNRFTRLRRLCLRQNFIQNIDLPPELAATLEELELYDNLIKHMQALDAYTELKSLDLSYNKLKHIKNISTLKKLDHIYFVQNRISKIENLAELTELRYLELGANKIKEIEGIETLTKLESLWLGQNRISRLQGLSTLTNLRTLSIQANRLTSLEGIAALPQLTELYISDNQIPSLEPLRSNTKLEILDFQTNPISSLQGIEGLSALENLWASNCQIESFQEIERALKDKVKLEEVYFEGNPVQKQGPVLYRNKVRLALPQKLCLGGLVGRQGDREQEAFIADILTNDSDRSGDRGWRFRRRRLPRRPLSHQQRSGHHQHPAQHLEHRHAAPYVSLFVSPPGVRPISLTLTFVPVVKQKRASLWYDFEAQALRLRHEPCLWYRSSLSAPVERHTWTQMYDTALRWSRFLEEQGAKPGELVGTYMQNSPEFMFNILACWAIGSAPALINYNLAGDSLLHCLKVSGSRVLVVDDDADCLGRIEAQRARIEGELGMKIVVLDQQTRDYLHGLPAIRPPDSYRKGVTGAFPIFLVYTSGTTGFPKACSFPTTRAYALLGGPVRMGLKSGPDAAVFYDCMPLYHGTGCVVALGAMLSGVTLAIGRKFSARSFWPDIHDSNAGGFVYVGETARYLLAAPPSPLDRGHKLKLMYGNGLRPDVWTRFQERFDVPTVIEFFNSTEGMFGLINTCKGPFHAAHVGHHGALLRWRLHDMYVPVEIDHEKGDQIWRDAKTGFARRTSYEEGGEILVKCISKQDFVGYWQNPSATTKRFEQDVFQKGDLYYRTGDALRRDADGRWFFMDRLGDTFRWKSENVSTAEVAEVLGRFPQLLEANVYGVQVPGHDGRAGCAAVYIHPHERAGFDHRGLLAYARKRLPRYAVPVFLRVIQSPTPMHNNKQNKVPLRKEGVDPTAIKDGTAGPEDVLLWVKPGGDTYEKFEDSDWKGLVAGKARKYAFSSFKLADPRDSSFHPIRHHRSKSVPAAPSRTSSSLRIVSGEDYADDHEELPFLRELHGKSSFAFWRLPARYLLAILFVLLVAIQFSIQPQLLDLVFGSSPVPPRSCPSPTYNPFIQDLYCRVQPTHAPGSLYNKSPRSMALAAAAQRVAAEFEYKKEDVNRGVAEFVRQMSEGLTKDGASMSQIPTYVTAVPNGTEKGLYMAVDLGGTNFRVCSIQLHGNSTFSLTQSKVAIPKSLMVAKSSHDLFGFLAKQIESFLKTHHGDKYASHMEQRTSFTRGSHSEAVFSLGFTFSFPVQQSGINKGKLIRWTKGFDIPDTIGKDVCALLQKEIDALGLPVHVAALVNDTVGTLMARSYTSPGKTGTLLGAIFGTGTNGAYVEKLEKVVKLHKSAGAEQSTGDMIINTEWGSFDNQLSVLPKTKYDMDLDRESVNPGVQMFEKRVSGMFLGEILRRALLSLVKNPAVPLFSDEHSNQNDVHSTTSIQDDSKLWSQWGLDTSFLSITSGDNSQGLRLTRQTLDNEYGVSAPSAEDAEAVRLIASAIGKRAARLSAVAIAAVVIATGRLQAPADVASTNNAQLEVNEKNVVDIGVDGSLVEFYPNFEEYIRETLREVPQIGPQGEKRIRIGIAKDGSGVGAALIALVADQVSKGRGMSSKSLTRCHAPPFEDTKLIFLTPQLPVLLEPSPGYLPHSLTI